MRQLTLSQKTAAVATITIPLLLAACGSAAQDTPIEATQQAKESVTTVSVTRSAKPTATSSTPSTSKSSAPTSTTSTSTEPTPSTSSSRAEEKNGTAEPEKIDEAVAQAYDMFKPLANRSLFEQFNSCDPAGLKNSFNCSGPEVGQVQFFKSDSKATQTTQVLTELRSSRVLKDDGDRVIGWSTFGTTAVLTVVDNSRGLVMQQMISTDQVDPESKLEELGVLN